MPPRSRRATAEAAIAALEGRPELAEFVRSLTAPDKLTNRNVPIRENSARIQRIKDKAEAEHRTVTAVIAEGITDFLDGTLPVRPLVRGRRGTNQRDAMLNVRPDAELVTRLKDRCADDERAWIKPSDVYASILDRYDPPADEPDPAAAPDQG